MDEEELSISGKALNRAVFSELLEVLEVRFVAQVLGAHATVDWINDILDHWVSVGEHVDFLLAVSFGRASWKLPEANGLVTVFRTSREEDLASTPIFRGSFFRGLACQGINRLCKELTPLVLILDIVMDDEEGWRCRHVDERVQYDSCFWCSWQSECERKKSASCTRSQDMIMTCSRH